MKRGTIYPSWRYHPDGRAELCLTEKRDEEMGAEWSDEDVRFTAPINDAEPSPEEEPEPEAPVRRGRKPKAH